MEELRFISRDQAFAIREQFGTPVFVYDEATSIRHAEDALSFPHPYGLTVRYAMKANSNASLLNLYDRLGLHIDASSGYEVERAILAGVAPEKICLSSQEFPENFKALYDQGMSFNACSLNQIDRFGQLYPESQLGLRFNPGVGSGGTNKTNVGGPSSSFGIWHEFLDEVRSLIAKYRLKVFRIHTHIGSGSDPLVWQSASQLSLNIVKQFPEVTTLNLGGGYKVARMADEIGTDFQDIGAPIRDAFISLANETGRKIHLEIEPGTYLIANAGSILTTVQDIVSTGTEGYSFLKLDSGMTEILRPSLYGGQHPLIIIPQEDTGRTANYVAVGHCCESGDLVTPAPGTTDVLQARELAESSIGDLCVIEGAGAYCSSMPAKNYNSFPEAAGVLIRANGDIKQIRKRQTLEQMVVNEL
jgi:diaminopimelate decarboxylase